MAATPIRVGMLDHSGERTSCTVYMEEIAANGSNWPDLFAPATGSYDIFKAGLIAITKLNLTRTTAPIEVDQSVESVPSEATAQRETAIRWSYVDDVTGKKYRFDTPAPVDALLQSGTDVIDIVANVGAAAFVAIFEAQCVSPDGNAVTMTGARFVGRRN